MDPILKGDLPLTWALIAKTFLLGVISVIVYRRFFHPLKDVPGPALASVSRMWHIYHILKGDQNLELVGLHEKYGHFIRLAHNEVSVSHPEGIKKILLAPLPKADWYKTAAIPDYRFQTPMSTTDPKRKIERSRNFTAGYAMSNVLRSERAIDGVISDFLAHLDSASKSRLLGTTSLNPYTAAKMVDTPLSSISVGATDNAMMALFQQFL
ncbi:Pisatin demethylase [Madurella mycetomatis]|uniref:Pisatin demethylase n=1 Tax=Madurella mycetomatis TaxID=100816 RepID=A0A175VR14_9PEZI|nr:Pisatin demethylase [Madurella mycetomatis]